MNPREQPELATLPGFPIALEARGYALRHDGQAEGEIGAAGGLCRRGRPHPGWPPEVLAFDAQTGLLALADSVFFEDYREIDGLKLPFRVKLHGGQIAVNFTEIRHDAPVEDSRFERPAPSAAFEKNFAGLEDSRALPVLKRVIGQGVSPADGRMFHDLIVERGYHRALDIGTAEGYAALWLGLAMKRNGGQVITVEIEPETADRARANIRQAGLEGVDRFPYQRRPGRDPGAERGFRSCLHGHGSAAEQEALRSASEADRAREGPSSRTTPPASSPNSRIS